MKKRISVLGLILVLSLPLLGQYTSTPSFSLVSNIPWCASGNCLTSIGGNMTEVKAGTDGTIWGLNASHVLYNYTNHAWTVLPSSLQSAGGNSIVHISVGDATHALVLSSAASGNNVFVLNYNNNTWQATSPGHVCTTAEFNYEGNELWCLSGSSIYRFNGTWILEPGSLASLSTGSASQVWGVNASGSLYHWNGTGLTNVPVSGFTPAHSLDSIAVAGGEGSLILLLDIVGGIHLSTNLGATWSTISGTANSVTAGGTVNLFTHSSNGASYHINTLVLLATAQSSGTWNCPVGNGCPPNSYHTLKATSKFGGLGGRNGTAGVTGQAQGYPQSYLNAIAQESAARCDLIYGNKNAPECTPTISGEAICSVMGALWSMVIGSLQPDVVQVALTAGTYVHGTGYRDPNGPDGMPAVLCGTQNACDAQHTPPRCDIPTIAMVPEDWMTPDQQCTEHEAWLVQQPTIHIPAIGWVCTTTIAGEYGRLLYDVTVLGPNSPEIPYPCTK